MKTTIKSIRMEKFEGNYSGKLLVKLSDTVLGYERKVDNDGVITFEQCQTDTMRIQLIAFSAQVRNGLNVGDYPALEQAFGYRLDAAKKEGVEELISVFNVLLGDAKIDVEHVVIAKDEANEGSHEAIQYKITNVTLTEVMRYFVGQFFVENFNKMKSPEMQDKFIAKLFGVKL